MAAGHRDGVDHFGAQLVGKLPQVGFREVAKVGRRVDRIQ